MHYYAILLFVSLGAGIAVTLWGWKILIKSRTARQWPVVEGVIEVSQLGSPSDDLLPHIEFSYWVDGKHYQQALEFPEGTNPMPEFAKSYIEKYPLASKVHVHYQPQAPANATLEPGARGDWMIITLGIVVTVASAIALFIHL